MKSFRPASRREPPPLRGGELSCYDENTASGFSSSASPPWGGGTQSPPSLWCGTSHSCGNEAKNWLVRGRSFVLVVYRVAGAAILLCWFAHVLVGRGERRWLRSVLMLSFFTGRPLWSTTHLCGDINILRPQFRNGFS